MRSLLKSANFRTTSCASYQTMHIAHIKHQMLFKPPSSVRNLHSLIQLSAS